MGKNKIGFLGLGQAGGNICEVAEFYEYKTIVFNTSPEDLDSLKLIKYKKLIGSKGGCGKDRNEAKEEIKSYYKNIVNDVKERFSSTEVDLIYVVFSTGGGTGSGMGPILLDILNKLIPDIKFAALVVLPSLSESLVAQVNTLECLKEIYELNLPTILIDNESYAKKDKKTMYDRINNDVVKKINILFDKDRKPSKYGNIDMKDLFKLLTTPGILMIVESIFDYETYRLKKFPKILMDDIAKSVFSEIDYDNIISRMGFMMELNKDISEDLNIFTVQDELGTPLEIFEGYYDNPHTQSNKIISILAGLSFPESRLELIQGLLDESKDIVKIKDENKILGNTSSEGSDWFNTLRVESSFTTSDKNADIEADIEEFNLDDLFGKY